MSFANRNNLFQTSVFDGRCFFGEIEHVKKVPAVKSVVMNVCFS